MLRRGGRLMFVALAAALGAGWGRPAAAQKLVRDYGFQETLKDSGGQGPDLKPLNGKLGAASYKFDAGQGLELPKAGVTDHYTIEIKFHFDKVDEWQKIVDFKKRTSDNGLYVYNGMLQFYDFGIGGDLQAGQDYEIRLERDRATKMVRGFVNGLKVFEFADTADHAVLDGETAFFFVDDLTTADEASAGAVSHIRIWDAPGGK
jgi:OmpA-OmpF porin, OOP family